MQYDVFRFKPLFKEILADLQCNVILLGVGLASAKLGINKPQLLPREFTTVIDVAGFLSDGQLSVLSRNTERASVDLDIPRSFWSRLAGKYDTSTEAAVMAISSCLREHDMIIAIVKIYSFQK
ncbi:hypothetical protein K2173_019471 [Erythroxylum novogranatense]|uniref:Uncharacterized protein n=1 Tax=Erythroxylum novogranatense TaxID=1862640 RepID=A0AAV8UG34_9ROSI|nr:hypothetical protein K2173_019471 [Erythroxylum novogranatense]